MDEEETRSSPHENLRLRRLRLRAETLTKFDPRAKKLILVGYDSESSNYRCYDPVTKVVSVSRHVAFNEQEIDVRSEVPVFKFELTLPMHSNIEEEEDHQDAADGNGVVVGKARAGDVAAENDRAEQAAGRVEEKERENVQDVQQQQQEEPTRMQMRDQPKIRPPEKYGHEPCLVEYNVPATYQEAVSSPEATKWAEAIEEELDAHQQNGTWQIVSRIPGGKTIGSKWVFKVLHDAKGNFVRFKARLCARGFMQREGVDYLDTFSPVIRYDFL